MGLYYITGVSGTGKSTVLEALCGRDFEAYGIDEDGYGKWVHRSTGDVGIAPVNKYFDIHEWYREYDWRLDVDKVKRLQEQARGGAIFLCGNTSGDLAAGIDFDAVFALDIERDILEQRIKKRTNNDFGKTPQELHEIIVWHSGAQERYKNKGVALIDANRPVELIVDEILGGIDIE